MPPPETPCDPGKSTEVNSESNRLPQSQEVKRRILPMLRKFHNPARPPDAQAGRANLDRAQPALTWARGPSPAGKEVVANPVRDAIFERADPGAPKRCRGCPPLPGAPKQCRGYLFRSPGPQNIIGGASLSLPKAKNVVGGPCFSFRDTKTS